MLLLRKLEEEMVSFLMAMILQRYLYNYKSW